jgi:hypothetical protein
MPKTTDADGDAKVTPAEHATTATEQDADIDADNDGSHSATEIAAANVRMEAEDTARTGTAATPGSTDRMAKAEKSAKATEDWVKKHDTNNDGKLSASEHSAASQAMFAKLDTDNDGSLSKAECEAGEKADKAKKYE